MATPTFNPYPALAGQLAKGLDSISAALNPTSTVDDLVNAIYNFIQPLYYPATAATPVPEALQIEIKSVAYNMINAYNNKALGGTIIYDDEQMKFIGMLLGLNTTNNTPINALNSWLLDIEDNISEADLSLDAQTPLLLTTETGKAVYAYWVSKVATPGTWAPFFQNQAPLNYANIPNWVAACMAGTLIGANASQKGLIAPTTDITSVNIISALIGALAIGAGKVIFHWVPNIQPKDLISDTNGMLLGGFSDAIDIGVGSGAQLTKRNDGCQTNARCNNVSCTNTCTNTGTCGGSAK
ncbi:MAG TPA: hypothetical protein VNZ49_15230 [Bacteroidia bacterium]|jgi:hypothetical protein|nr:hypothetical protein [Bacteroidia bacterium]